ncbi:MAG: dethiobiotin synthase [Bacteroidetes bacterium]|nr:dethiobiotin synthase [Bacteroidota bacterium]MBU1719021.1 dethiobiotin synthase [Bacteroidota bacterium]
MTSITNQRPLFITGIGTGVGKTVVSAIICQASGAAYWKPVQTGDQHNSDTIEVSRLITNPEVQFIPERFRLKQPLSPHAAAEMEGIAINPDDFRLPEVRPLLIEGAGGVMVPLNNQGFLMSDMMKRWNVKVIIVSDTYLGSINHTLLTIEYLKQKHIEISGVIFNNAGNIQSENVILNFSGIPCLLRIYKEQVLTPGIIAQYAGKLIINRNRE